LLGPFLVWSERQYTRGMTGKVSRGELQGGSVCGRKRAADMSVGGLSYHAAGLGAEENGSLVRLVAVITMGDR